LRISNQCFYQGIRQTAFFHVIPLEDDRYDVDKNVIDGKLISVDGDKDEDVEVQGENLGEPSSEVEHSSNAL